MLWSVVKVQRKLIQLQCAHESYVFWFVPCDLLHVKGIRYFFIFVRKVAHCKTHSIHDKCYYRNLRCCVTELILVSSKNRTTQTVLSLFMISATGTTTFLCFWGRFDLSYIFFPCLSMFIVMRMQASDQRVVYFLVFCLPIKFNYYRSRETELFVLSIWCTTIRAPFFLEAQCSDLFLTPCTANHTSIYVSGYKKLWLLQAGVVGAALGVTSSIVALVATMQTPRMVQWNQIGVDALSTVYQRRFIRTSCPCAA